VHSEVIWGPDKSADKVSSAQMSSRPAPPSTSSLHLSSEIVRQL
jgi:hypothetical protein